QRWRARATSARSCSAACRLFFESDVVMLEEAPHRAAAARNLVPVHRQNRLVQGQVWPSRNQTQQKICMLLQRRDAPAPPLTRTAARLPKALDPDNRRAGTDIKLLGRRAPRRPAFNFRNHSRPHVFRIGLRHRPASQNRINADRLSHPSPSENLLDSIGTEHALDYRPTPIGALSLRRRRELKLGVDVFEIKLGDEFLMSSLFTASEIALARLGLAELSEHGLAVVVGGLGLGYTAKAVLEHQKVASLLVVEALEAVIEWHAEGRVPLGPGPN